MSSYITGLVVSTLLSILLLMLFKHEEQTGVRYGAQIRIRFDYLVLRVAHSFHRIIDAISRDSARQIFHYILHTLLKLVLHVNKRWENGVRNMMRVNKTLARDAERERTTRNKLEEIALHKIKYALTEDEKKKHRDKMLQG